MMAASSDTKPRSFHPPQEPEWHRMISEAAYYLAQKRGFLGKHALDDWLAAEQQVRQAISPRHLLTRSPAPTGPIATSHGR
jgi:hypothetical protein